MAEAAARVFGARSLRLSCRRLRAAVDAQLPAVVVDATCTSSGDGGGDGRGSGSQPAALHAPDGSDHDDLSNQPGRPSGGGSAAQQGACGSAGGEGLRSTSSRGGSPAVDTLMGRRGGLPVSQISTLAARFPRATRVTLAAAADGAHPSAAAASPAAASLLAALRALPGGAWSAVTHVELAVPEAWQAALAPEVVRLCPSLQEAAAAAHPDVLAAIAGAEALCSLRLAGLSSFRPGGGGVPLSAGERRQLTLGVREGLAALAGRLRSLSLVVNHNTASVGANGVYATAPRLAALTALALADRQWGHGVTGRRLPASLAGLAALRTLELTASEAMRDLLAAAALPGVTRLGLTSDG